MLGLDIEFLKINHVRPRTHLAGSFSIVTSLSILVSCVLSQAVVHIGPSKLRFQRNRNDVTPCSKINQRGCFKKAGTFRHIELMEIGFSGPKCIRKREAEFQVEQSQRAKSLSIRKLRDGHREGCRIEPE